MNSEGYGGVEVALAFGFTGGDTGGLLEQVVSVVLTVAAVSGFVGVSLGISYLLFECIGHVISYELWG